MPWAPSSIADAQALSRGAAVSEQGAADRPIRPHAKLPLPRRSHCSRAHRPRSRRPTAPAAPMSPAARPPTCGWSPCLRASPAGPNVRGWGWLACHAPSARRVPSTNETRKNGQVGGGCTGRLMGATATPPGRADRGGPPAQGRILCQQCPLAKSGVDCLDTPPIVNGKYSTKKSRWGAQLKDGMRSSEDLPPTCEAKATHCGVKDDIQSGSRSEARPSVGERGPDTGQRLRSAQFARRRRFWGPERC